jgi:acetyl esterase/lipase
MRAGSRRGTAGLCQHLWRPRESFWGIRTNGIGSGAESDFVKHLEKQRIVPLRLAGPVALLLGLLMSLASGCTGLTLALANAPALFGDYEAERDIGYGGDAGRLLDVYRPAAAHAGTRPVIVFLHGGGWVNGSKKQYRFVAEALTSRGYLVVVPAYRLYPIARFPAFVEDAAQAVAWTRKHAAEFGGDPQRLFVMGHSAGAHIAALLNFDERYLLAVGGERSWLSGFIGLSGPYDFLPLRDPILQEVFAPESQYPLSQPVNFVDGTESPTLLLHGRADGIVWPINSEHLAAKVREHGGRVEERYYDGMSHGGTLAAMSVYYRSRRTVLDEIDAFTGVGRAVSGNTAASATAR